MLSEVIHSEDQPMGSPPHFKLDEVSHAANLSCHLSGAGIEFALADTFPRAAAS